MIPKFRAWYVLAEEMIDEILMISFVRKEVVGKFSDGSTSVPLKFEDKRNGEDVILMQSTGLFDKNGKEIFEGDVIAIEVDDTGTPINARVFQNSEIGILMFHVFEDDEDVPMVELLEDNSVVFAIIGNIYENQDILEE
nr:MAG TPA: YopX protein [Caudoviricetes sp.]